MKNNKNEYGFTLIEITVALGIFLLALSATFVIFDAQKKSYIAQRDVAAMQQNLRTGMYMIGRDIKMANCYLGELGIGWDDSKNGNGDGFIKGMTSWDNYNGGSDVIDIAYTSYTVKTTINTGMPKASGELKVSTNSMPGWDCESKGNEDCCSPTDEDGRYQECFEDGQLLILSDGINSNLFTAGNIQSCNKKGDCGVNHPPALPFNQAANTNWPAGGYGTGSKVTKLKYISYKIDRTDDPDDPYDDDDPEHPKLSFCNQVMPDTEPDNRTMPVTKGSADTMDCYQPIAENVEDLQFVYIFQNDNEENEIDDSTCPSTENFTPAQIDSMCNLSTSNCFTCLKTVRVSISARSDKEFSYYEGQKPHLANNPEGAKDHRMRRVYTSEYETRNIRLDWK